ncbi:MAG: DUF2721 domain-containing protein [Planctomycetes bacterium]|nr:DUF2721 domain-containing protein [Planctomycetota bacterium]
MTLPATDPFVLVLQTAISPVALISGVGLLVLSMTNRFGRTADRARGLAAQWAGADEAHRVRLVKQIRILYRRSRLLLYATGFALASVLVAVLLVVALFVHYLAGVNLHRLVVVLFVLSLATLVASLGYFIKDMTLSLRALREELQDHL